MLTTASDYSSSGSSRIFSGIYSRFESVRCPPSRNSISQQPRIFLSTAALALSRQLASAPTCQLTRSEDLALESITGQPALSLFVQAYSIPIPASKTSTTSTGSGLLGPKCRFDFHRGERLPSQSDDSKPRN